MSCWLFWEILIRLRLCREEITLSIFPLIGLMYQESEKTLTTSFLDVNLFLTCFVMAWYALRDFRQLVEQYLGSLCRRKGKLFEEMLVEELCCLFHWTDTC